MAKIFQGCSLLTTCQYFACIFRALCLLTNCASCLCFISLQKHRVPFVYLILLITTFPSPVLVQKNGVRVVKKWTFECKAGILLQTPIPSPFIVARGFWGTTVASRVTDAWQRRLHIRLCRNLLRNTLGLSIHPTPRFACEGYSQEINVLLDATFGVLTV